MSQQLDDVQLLHNHAYWKFDGYAFEQQAWSIVAHLIELYAQVSDKIQHLSFCPSALRA